MQAVTQGAQTPQTEPAVGNFDSEIMQPPQKRLRVELGSVMTEVPIGPEALSSLQELDGAQVVARVTSHSNDSLSLSIEPKLQLSLIDQPVCASIH